MKGAWGPYALKLILDILVVMGFISSAHICLWPVECEGYKKSMKGMFPNLDESEWLHAFHYIHLQLSHKFHCTFPEIIMHLCWKKRRADGKLVDALPDFDTSDSEEE